MVIILSGNQTLHDTLGKFNSERPHGSIDDLTPLEVELLDYARIEPVEQAG